MKRYLEIKISKFWRMVKERCKRKPVSKILGYRSFWGRDFEINENVLYAELNVNMIIDKYSDKPIHFKKISKFPEVSRDLSILIDKEVRFEDIYVFPTM